MGGVLAIVACVGLQEAANPAAAAAKPKGTLTILAAPIGQSRSGGTDLTPATASFSPAKPGATVTIERLVSGKWTKRLTGKQDKSGRFAFVLTAGPRSAPYAYRARSAAGSTTVTSASAKSASWKLAWSDEFNLGILGPQWSIRRSGGPGTSRSCAATSVAQTTVKGGSANLGVLLNPTAIPNKTSACPHGQWNNAMVGTQFSKGFTYGYIAARVRFPSERGMHGSIWMQHNGLRLTQVPKGGNDDGGPLPAVVPEPPALLPVTEPEPEPTPTDQAPDPSADPTADPTAEPTADPTAEPPAEPTADPAAEPTADPTAEPTADPAAEGAPEEGTGEPPMDLQLRYSYEALAAAGKTCGAGLGKTAYGNPKTEGAEIDLVEYFGDGASQGGMQSNVYWHGKDSAGAPSLNGCGRHIPEWTSILAPGQTPSNGYHVYSVEWTPTSYVFRIDGFETLRVTEGVSGVPEYLIMSLLTSDWELPAIRPTKPAQMNVDWVRVWQK